MLLADGVQHFPRNGSRATVRSLKNGAVLAAAPAHAVLSFCLAFRQTGKRRKKSGVVLISQKLTLFFDQRAVAATIGSVKPIDFRLSGLRCGPLRRLPRRVVFAAFPGGFEVVACPVGRPRKCQSQCNDCNVAHPSIPPRAATTHRTQEPSAKFGGKCGLTRQRRPAFPRKKPSLDGRPPSAKAVPGKSNWRGSVAGLKAILQPAIARQRRLCPVGSEAERLKTSTPAKSEPISSAPRLT